MELYLHFPNTSSWLGTYLSTGTTLQIPFLCPRVGLVVRLVSSAVPTITPHRSESEPMFC